MLFSLELYVMIYLKEEDREKYYIYINFVLTSFSRHLDNLDTS